MSHYLGEFKSSKKMQGQKAKAQAQPKQKSPARTQKIKASPAVKKVKRPASQLKNKSSTQKEISLLLRSTRPHQQFQSKFRESSTKSPGLREPSKRTDRLSQVSFSQGYSSRKCKSKERTLTPFRSVRDWAAGELIGKRYETMELLGEGAFGVVIRCLDRKTRREVAVKVIEYDEDSREAVECEVEMLAYLKQCRGVKESSTILLKDHLQTSRHIVVR
jgi:hypothetical protein